MTEYYAEIYMKGSKKHNSDLFYDLSGRSGSSPAESIGGRRANHSYRNNINLQFKL